jgi:hypothetical protein
VEAGKRAAATAAVAAAAPAAGTAGLLLQPELAFSSCTYLMVPIYFIMAFWPRSRLVRDGVMAGCKHLSIPAHRSDKHVQVTAG